MSDKPSYYSILTADVRYDKRLKPNEKILFSEITALTQANGICWATNDYFSKLYDVEKVTVSKWINNLKKLGYIDVKMIYRDNTKEIEKRVISVRTKPIDEIIEGYRLKNKEGYRLKNLGGIDKKVKDNNTSINTTSNNNKHMCDSKESHEKPKTKQELLREDFETIWKLYPSTRRRDKEKCFTRYKNAIKDGETRENIYLGVRNYIQHCKDTNTDNEFIRLTSTFFNNRNWNDFLNYKKENTMEQRDYSAWG